MPITIGSNLASLQVQRQLGRASSALDSTFEKLSSGMRINRAKDDAAGLSVATALTSSAKILRQGVRNVNDGVSLLNIAEDGLRQLSSIVIRQRELATQSLNGTFTHSQRKSLHAEATALTAEYNRIVQSTSFNGINPLASTDSGITLQVGLDSNGTLRVDTGTGTDGIGRTVGTGLFDEANSITGINASGESQSVDYNKDGFLDVIAGGVVNLGNGDGTFNAPVCVAVGAHRAYLYDVTGDNVDDLIFIILSATHVEVRIGNGDGTYGAVTSTASPFVNTNQLEFGDINGDGLTDLIAMNTSAQTGIVRLSNGDGTFASGTSFSLDLNAGLAALADVNNDGRADLIDYGNAGTIKTYLSNGTGFGSLYSSVAAAGAGSKIRAEDLNGDGSAEIVLNDGRFFLNNGDGTFAAAISLATAQYANLADVNGDGRTDVLLGDTGSDTITTVINNGNGTFTAAISNVFSPGITSSDFDAVGDFNGDGALDVSIKLQGPGYRMIFGTSTTTTSAAEVNLRTRAGAYAAVESLSTVQDSINKALGTIGAHLSRLSSALNNNQIAVENFLTAASQINDTDVAQESATLVSTRILQQAATAVLAQANQGPALALKLLNS